MEIASELLATPSDHQSDDVKNVVTALGSNRLKEALDDSTKRRRQDYKATSVNLSLKHGLASGTYSKKSLIMASIIGSKSKSFMIMSIPPQGEPLIYRLVPNGSFSNLPFNNNPQNFNNQSNLEGLVSNFMASQDTRLSKFEADFKQQQSKMTNEINIFLKTINDRITGALPSDTVKNSKLNVNSTFSLLSARSYLMEDPQSSSRRGFLASANVVLDYKKAKVSVEEGVTRSIFGVKEINLSDEEIPCWTTLGKRESYTPRPSTDGIDSVLSPFKDVLVFRKMVEFLGAIPFNIKRNMWESKELIKKKIDWNKPPKEGDGAWHIRIELIDPRRRNFQKDLSINSHH
uniref:MAK10-like protein n=1 Tax=Tanacetum cinerariifolium TaxID=118510 RepID=A0A6L2JBZ3_TANCI|nr:hypothetical protein [Tanacetum cinerariifolium]